MQNILLNTKQIHSYYFVADYTDYLRISQFRIRTKVLKGEQ